MPGQFLFSNMHYQVLRSKFPKTRNYYKQNDDTGKHEDKMNHSESLTNSSKTAIESKRFTISVLLPVVTGEKKTFKM